MNSILAKHLCKYQHFVKIFLKCSDWRTKHATLNFPRSRMGSQWSSGNTGEIWSLQRVSVICRAVAFCTDCSLRSRVYGVDWNCKTGQWRTGHWRTGQWRTDMGKWLCIQRLYQFTGTHNSFESVLGLKTYEIHIDRLHFYEHTKSITGRVVYWH